MRQRIGRSPVGAIAPVAALLAALVVNGARAGDSDPDPGNGVSGPRCGAPGESCARIRGYIRAGSEFPERTAQRTAGSGPPPLLSDLGRAASDALNRGIVLLKVSGDGVR